MKKPLPITKFHIAPCGMNCGICKGYLRDKNKCSGCRAGRKYNSRRLKCIIKDCPKRVKNNWEYCFECNTFPCTRMKKLDKRYRTNYGMSMVENLKHIKKNGIQKFVKHEQKRWIKGDKILCVHNRELYTITKT